MGPKYSYFVMFQLNFNQIYPQHTYVESYCGFLSHFKKETSDDIVVYHGWYFIDKRIYKLDILMSISVSYIIGEDTHMTSA